MYSYQKDTCYNEVITTHEIVVVKAGESGYWHTGLFETDPIKRKALVREMNEKIGVNPAEAAAMSHGSMFGWDTLGANPAAYDKDGQPYVSKIELPLSLGGDCFVLLENGSVHQAEVCDLTYKARARTCLVDTRFGNLVYGKNVFKEKAEADEKSERYHLENKIKNWLYPRRTTGLVQTFLGRSANSNWCVYGSKAEFCRVMDMYLAKISTEHIKTFLNENFGKRTKA